MFKYGLLVGVLGAYVCVTSAAVCTLQHDPVCGTDGKTYSNNCFLALKMAKDPHLQLKYNGPCEKHDRKIRSVCSAEIKNVCGSDGITYRNPCVLNNASNATNKVKLLHHGACNNKSVEMIVNQTHEEIKHNFTKVATRQHIQSFLKNKTPAKPEVQSVTITKDTVQTEPLENKNATDIVPNENPSIELSCPCGLELEEICGNDGVTYDNPCLLHCAAKLNNTLEIHFEGRCNGSELIVAARKPRSITINNNVNAKFSVNGKVVHVQDSDDDKEELLCGCDRNYLAVCGTNGVTYKNRCLMECAAKGDKSIGVKFIGRCDGKDAFSRDPPKLDITINGKKYFEDDEDIFGRDLTPEVGRRLKRDTEKMTKREHAKYNPPKGLYLNKKITKRHAKMVTFRF